MAITNTHFALATSHMKCNNGTVYSAVITVVPTFRGQSQQHNSLVKCSAEEHFFIYKRQNFSGKAHVMPGIPTAEVIPIWNAPDVFPDA